MAVGFVALVCSLYLMTNRSTTKPPISTPPQPAIALLTNAPPSVSSNTTRHVKVKTRYSEFTDAERAEFEANFESKYKPALSNWCKAYGDHVPFSPDAVTQDKLAERVGVNALYHEYIFVVDGITVGIQDTKGMARVDYLNNPVQTKQLAMQPDGTAPVIVSPVPRADVIAMLAAESGNQFPPDQVKLVPSGFSGGLNGGVLVHIGGTPDDAASWKYDFVFGSDGKLAYYLKGR